MDAEEIRSDPTIIGDDGRILLMSCRQFVRDICQGSACFVCGAAPSDRRFNDEHIVPRWVLRRFGLFDKSITLPTGELRKYGGYRVQCCVECNSLLGDKIETPVSTLLDGTFPEISSRLKKFENQELLFVWLTLLFLKIHLKDKGVPVHKDRRLGSEVVGEWYEWETFHHLHAVARSPYTGARLLPEVIGSVAVFEIDPSQGGEQYDYLNFSLSHTMVVRLGPIGIVATLTDSGAAQMAWSEKLAVVDGPINLMQLREIGAMFATANDAIKVRPQFGTMFTERSWLLLFAKRPPGPDLEEFDPVAFGHALLFAVQQYVKAGVIDVDGTRDPEAVAAAIRTGHVRFLTDSEGKLRRPS